MSPIKYFLLLLAAAVTLGVGIADATGLTGKDEYLLGLRIPLEMMQGDHWWVPFIDGAPRLKKPPLLYWLGRASFETFGPSLAAARGITIAFALVLLGCTAWLGRQLGAQWRIGLIAAGVLLGMGGLASESRRFMLDVPVAAFSLAAFCCYWVWLERSRGALLAATALLLSAALLTKGPIALVVCGSGVLALWITRADLRGRLPRLWLAHLLLAAMMLVLPVVWYLYVRDHYGAQLAQAASEEIEARQIGLSAQALGGIIAIALPWSFVALYAMWSQRRDDRIKFLVIWLSISLLPFFFIRVFERYLIGSLPVLALATALALECGAVPAWTRRLGSILPALVAVMLALLLWRWQLGGWQALAAVTFGFLAIWWWRTMHPVWLVASAAGLWAIGWGVAFPALGVNAIPQSVLDLAKDKTVILFGGPQPALLPILEQRPFRQTSHIATPVASGTLIAVRAEDRHALDSQTATLGLRMSERLQYQALTSAGSGVRFAREGTTRDDWRRAWDERNPAPLMSTVQILEVMP